MDGRDDHAAGAGSGTPTEMLLNVARGAKGLALLLFLMPWLTVSCAGQSIMPMSGFQLATGTVAPPTGMPVDAAALASQSADLLLVLAALLIVAALAATFVLARRVGALVAMGACAAALGILVYDVLIRLRGKVQDGIPGQDADGSAAGNAVAPANDLARQMDQAITVDILFGFWLCLLALIAAIVLLNMVRSRGTDL